MGYLRHFPSSSMLQATAIVVDLIVLGAPKALGQQLQGRNPTPSAGILLNLMISGKSVSTLTGYPHSLLSIYRLRLLQTPPVHPGRHPRALPNQPVQLPTLGLWTLCELTSHARSLGCTHRSLLCASKSTQRSKVNIMLSR